MEERATLVCKAYLRGVCEEAEFYARMQELGFAQAKADAMLIPVMEEMKRRK